MAVLLLLLALLGWPSLAVSTGPSSEGTAVATAPTSLAISVWPRGPIRSRAVRWTLRCSPSGGTLTRAADACRRLSTLDRPFAPVPDGTACTAVYGGPQVARVRGTFRGRRVDAWFNRQDGCAIARWDRVRFLFPAR